MRWGVVVVAGGLVKDPLASAIGTPRKALASIGGRTCLARTLDAVRDAELNDCVTVSGEDVEEHVHHGMLVHERDSQIENARYGVEALPSVDAVLFLPADSPLLEASTLTKFMDDVTQRINDGEERWLAAGLTGLEEFREQFPSIGTQPIRLRDGDFLSGALFATSPAAFLNAIALIDEMSKSRKNQVALLMKLGFWTVIKYLMNRVSIADAEEKLGKIFEGQAIVVTGCDPCMAADIDDVADYDELRIHTNLKKSEES